MTASTDPAALVSPDAETCPAGGIRSAAREHGLLRQLVRLTTDVRDEASLAAALPRSAEVLCELTGAAGVRVTVCVEPDSGRWLEAVALTDDVVDPPRRSGAVTTARAGRDDEGLEALVTVRGAADGADAGEDLAAVLAELLADAARRVVLERRQRAHDAWTTQLLDLLPATAVVGLDTQGRVTAWSRGAEHHLGPPPAAALGRPLAELLTDPEWAAGIAQALERAASERFETSGWRTTRQGSRFLRTIVSPVHDDQNAPLGFVVAMSDDTTETLALRAAHVNESRLAVLAENAQDGIFEVGLHRKHPVFRFASRAFREFVGLEQEANVALAELEQRVHPEDRSLHRELFGAGSDGERREATYRTLDREGRWRTVHTLVTVIDDPVTGTRALQGISRDVTAQENAAAALRSALETERRTTDELRELESLRAHFLTAVSHELRTPVTTLAGFARTLARHGDRLPLGTRREVYAGMVRSADRLESLLIDLLDLQRLRSDRMTARRLPVELFSLAQATVSRWQDARVLLQGEVVTVAADRALVERALDHLVRNAVEHNPPGTTVVVTVRRTEGGAELRVEDDGFGIPADARDQVVGEFVQGASRRSSPSPGLGIGLSFTRRVMLLHSGDMQLHDRPTGGTAVLLRLPAA